MYRIISQNWAEQDAFSIPRLPFLPAEQPPPCTDYAEAFTTASDDNRAKKGGRAGRRRIVNAEKVAKAVCATCPVLTACRNYALTTRQTWGVWGGTNPLEREMWWRKHPTRKGEPPVTPQGKFDDVPTIELFSAESLRAPTRDSHDKQRRKPTPAVGQGNCPHCLKLPATLVAQGPHWVWKAHTFKTWGGDTRDCPASGVALCVAPEPNNRSYSGIPQRCPHGVDPLPPAQVAA